MSRFIPLIGGPKNGETIELPDTINFKAVDMGNIDGEVIYTVCRSGDGYGCRHLIMPSNLAIKIYEAIEKHLNGQT